MGENCDIIALVTCGGSGLGACLVKALLDDGMKVAFTDSRMKLGLNLESKLKKKFGNKHVLFVHCDFLNVSQFEGSLDRCIDFFGSISLVINHFGNICEYHKDFVVEYVSNAFKQNTEIGTEILSSQNKGIIINIAYIKKLLNCIHLFKDVQSCITNFSAEIDKRVSVHFDMKVRVYTLIPELFTDGSQNDEIAGDCQTDYSTTKDKVIVDACRAVIYTESWKIPVGQFVKIIDNYEDICENEKNDILLKFG